MYALLEKENGKNSNDVGFGSMIQLGGPGKMCAHADITQFLASYMNFIHYWSLMVHINGILPSIVVYFPVVDHHYYYTAIIYLLISMARKIDDMNVYLYIFCWSSMRTIESTWSIGYYNYILSRIYPAKKFSHQGRYSVIHFSSKNVHGWAVNRSLWTRTSILANSIWIDFFTQISYELGENSLKEDFDCISTIQLRLGS